MKRKSIVYFLSIVLTITTILAFNAIFYTFKYPLKYKSEIIKYSTTYNLDPTFVASVINAESSFNPKVVSKKGAIGLMQILPSTAEYVAKLLNEDYSLQKIYEPETNIRYGCYYLRYLENKFSTEKEVLCAYNAGETVVNSWLKNTSLSPDGKTIETIPYQVTKNYTQKIISGKKFYKGRI